MWEHSFARTDQDHQSRQKIGGSRERSRRPKTTARTCSRHPLSFSKQFCQRTRVQPADALRSRASTHHDERERLRTVTTSTQTGRDAPSGPNAAVPTDLPAMTPAGRPERRTMHLRPRHHGSVRGHRRHSTASTEASVRTGHAMATHTHTRSLRISRTGYRDAKSNGRSRSEQVPPHRSSPFRHVSAPQLSEANARREDAFQWANERADDELASF